MTNETEEVLNDRSLQQVRLQRTLNLWNKLQDRIEEALNSEEISASMISSISKTLIEQFKMDKTSPEKAAEALESNEVTVDDKQMSQIKATHNPLNLPFPIDPTTETLEANLDEAADVSEGENKEWVLAGKLPIKA